MSFDSDFDDYPVRQGRQKQNYRYNDFSGSSSEDNDPGSEFTEPEDDQDDLYVEEMFNKKSKKKKGTKPVQKKQVNERPTDGLYIQPRKRKSDSDSDDWSAKGFSYTCDDDSGLAYRRTKRSTKDVNYHDDLPKEIFFEKSSDDKEVPEQEQEEMLDGPPRPGIEKMFGVTSEGSFLVRLARSSNAEAVFMTREQIALHPGGTSQLSVFDGLVEEYGLKPNPSIPSLGVPNAPEVEEAEEKVIDHLITYDHASGLYLVKWRDIKYEDATWEHEVTDEHALEVLRKRDEYVPRTQRIQRTQFKDYGDGENCLPLPEYKNNNQLRSYQIEALNWLRFHYHTDTNSILADEMGLGKTVMCISLLHDIVTRCGVPGPFLIVAPLSTLPNWQREFENWTDIHAVVLHGSKQGRDVLKKYEVWYDPPHDNEPKVQVILTNIETVSKELELIQRINWHLVIIDEAQRLKNMRSKIYGMLYSLNMKHILLMTGTPIQNNIDEIFALLHFIAPNKFRTLEEFRETYHNVDTAEDVAKLQDAIRPYMLRRKKCDVETSIAAKEETIVEVELTRIQKFYYRLLIDKKANDLVSGASTVRLREMNNLAMQLRKICNHPFLLPEVEAEVVKPGQDPVETMIASCGKMVFVDKLLAKLSQTGTKVLIFSQMVRVLNILEDFLVYRGYKYERLDGRVQGAERQASIDRFNDPASEALVFLLCTKAGGVGLNLTAASTVIIYDSDWNPQNDVQAQARCHRIGQTRDVKVYRLITRGTYESEMFLRASMKLGLDQAILDSRPESANNLTAKEIEMLLKKGAYHVLNDDDETEMDKFVAEDIDQILERRTHNATTVATSSESQFSKASFVVEKDGEQLDINDENFWEKVIPKDQRRSRPSSVDIGRMRKSRSSEIYDLPSDDDEEYGSSWNTVKRDRILSLMLCYGYGRWDEIHEKIKTTVSAEMMLDGAAVIVFLIAQSLDVPEELLSPLFGVRNMDLTYKQRRLMTSELFSNKRWREQLKKNAQSHTDRLINLKTIADWVTGGCPKVRYDAATAPKNWKAEYDAKLLTGTYKHGWGEWTAMTNDPEVWDEDMRSAGKISVVFARRLTTLCESINNGKAFAMLEIVTDALQSLTPETAKRLVTLISGVGASWERISELLVGHQEEEEEEEAEVDVQAVGPVILNCARIVAGLDPKSTGNAIRAAIRKYNKEADVLASALSYQAACRLTANVAWIQRVRDFLTVNELEERMFLTNPPSCPEWWKANIHSRAVLDWVNQWGLWNPPEFLMETDCFADLIDESTAENLGLMQERVQKVGFIKTDKGPFKFICEEDGFARVVDEIIEAAGGHNTPEYIDIPEEFKQGIDLPFTHKGITVETLGSGELMMLNGFICRRGFRSRVPWRNATYRCTVMQADLFEVWKSERAKWTGETPDEAWEACDKRFNGDGLEKFGITSTLVQYAMLKSVDEDLPEGFIEPKINFYQTELEKPKAKPKKSKAQQKKSTKKKRKMTETDSDDSDPSDDDFE